MSEQVEKQVVVDPKRYREISAPFNDSGEANQAVRAFYDDLDELRIKHRLPDVYAVVKLNYVAQVDGGLEELSTILSVHLGDSSNALPMAAWAYGFEDSQHSKRIQSMVAKARAYGGK